MHYHVCAMVDRFSAGVETEAPNLPLTRAAPAVGPAGFEPRRPGRADAVNPAIITRLRGKSPAAIDAAHPPLPRRRDDLAPARGIALSVICGASLWALLVLAAYLIFG